MTIQTKVTEQNSHAILFQYYAQGGSTFKSVYETLVCDHSNESYRAVLSCSTDY